MPARRPDEFDVTRQAFGQAAAEPVTWAPFLPVAAGFAFLGFPWWACAAAAGIIGSGVAWWWSRHWQRLCGKVRDRSVRECLDRENKALASLAEEARQGPRKTRNLGELIEEALRIKLAIEGRILADDTICREEAEVSELVSGLVQSIASETRALLARDARTGAAPAFRAIDEAMRSLRQARDQIELLLDPVSAVDPAGEIPSPLRRSTEQLQERIDAAHRVKAYLERTMHPAEDIPAAPSNPPQTEAH